MPRVKTTRMTKFALFCLQIYLFTLIGLLVVRFILRR
jgi:hypothetical protein